jgi:hypothetical protein
MADVIILKSPFEARSGVIEIVDDGRVGYKGPVIGSSYKFILAGAESPIEHFTDKDNETCYSVLHKISIKVLGELGRGRYSVSINLPFDASQNFKFPCEHDQIPADTELIEFTGFVGTGVLHAANYSNATTTKIGFAGEHISSASYKGFCTDDGTSNSGAAKFAYNYRGGNVAGAFTNCEYGKIEIQQAQDAGYTVEMLDLITEGGQYIDLQYAPTGINGQYQFWVNISASIWNMTQYILWDMSYESPTFNSHAPYASLNGPLHTFGAGTYIIRVHVGTGYAIFADEVVITVDATVTGCMDSEALNYNSSANQDDGSCIYTTIGCTDAAANNYNALANVACGSAGDSNSSVLNYCCKYDGCTDSLAQNYDPIATDDDGSCVYESAVPGCTDATAWNYNSNATEDDGSCIAKVEGCLDPLADNYGDQLAQGVNFHNIEHCDYGACTDSTASNYNGALTLTVNDYVNVQSGAPSFGYYPQVHATGTSVIKITDDGATDTNGDAVPEFVDNGTCTYPVTVTQPCASMPDWTTEILGEVSYEASASTVTGYIYDATALTDGSNQLSNTAGKACIDDLTITTDLTWSGITYKKFTRERVKVQRISKSNPILYLQDPDTYGEVVYTTAALTDPAGAPTATAGGDGITDIYTYEDALALADAAAVAGWAGNITSTVEYYFVVISTTEDPLDGFMPLSSATEPVMTLFGDPNAIARIDYHGGYFLPSSGTASTFQTGSLNTDFPIGYRPGTTAAGLINNNSSAGCGGANDNDVMYTVYKVTMTDPCQAITVDFSEVFDSNVIGCTVSTEDNYDLLATGSSNPGTLAGLGYTVGTTLAELQASEISYLFDEYLANGGCYHEACTDSTYVEYDNSATAITDSTKCLTLKVYGCMDQQASNYNPLANIQEVGGEDISDGDFNNSLGLNAEDPNTWANENWTGTTVGYYNGWLIPAYLAVTGSGIMRIGNAGDATIVKNVIFSQNTDYTLKFKLTYSAGNQHFQIYFIQEDGVYIEPAGANLTSFANNNITEYTVSGLSFTAGNTIGVYMVYYSDFQGILHNVSLKAESTDGNPCDYELIPPSVYDSCSYQFENALNGNQELFDAANTVIEDEVWTWERLWKDSDFSAEPGLLVSCVSTLTSHILYTSEIINSVTYNYNQINPYIRKTQKISLSNPIFRVSPNASFSYYRIHNFLHNNGTPVTGQINWVSEESITNVLNQLTLNNISGTIVRKNIIALRFDTNVRFKMKPDYIQNCIDAGNCEDANDWHPSYAYSFYDIIMDMVDNGNTAAFIGIWKHATGSFDSIPSQFNGLGEIGTSEYLTSSNSNSYFPDPTEEPVTYAAYPDGYVYADDSVDADCDPNYKRPAYELLEYVPEGICIADFNFGPYIEEKPDATVYGCMDATATNYNSNATQNTAGYANNTECVYFVVNDNGDDPTIDTDDEFDGCSHDFIFQFQGAVFGSPWSNVVQAGMSVEIHQIVLNEFNVQTTILITEIAQWDPCQDGISATLPNSQDGTMGTYYEWEFSYSPYGEGGPGILQEIVPTDGSAIAGYTYTNEFVITVTSSYPEITYVNAEGETITPTQTISHTFTINNIIEGCTISTSFNFDPADTCNIEVGVEGACYPVIYGCSEPTAYNYNNGSFINDVPQPLSIGYNPWNGDPQTDVNTNNGTCIPVVTGCTDGAATNYNHGINFEDIESGVNIDYTTAGLTTSGNVNGSTVVENQLSINVNTSDPSYCYYCDGIAYIEEITESTSISDGNIIYQATTNGDFSGDQDGVNPDVPYSITAKYINTSALGTESPAIAATHTSDSHADIGYFYLNNASINIPYYLNAGAHALYSWEVTFNYNQGPALDGSNSTIDRCTDSNAQTIIHILSVDAQSYTLGCTDGTMFNHNENATIDDGSCYPYIYGCLVPAAYNTNNYNGGVEGFAATGDNYIDVNTQVISDHSEFNDLQCVYTGCTNNTANNYNELASVFTGNDGDSTDPTSNNYCEFHGCTEDWADNFQDHFNVNDGSCFRNGCTDSNASNYDEAATIDDGTCFYNGCMDHGLWPSASLVSAAIYDTLNPQGIISIFPGTPADNYDSFATVHVPEDCTYSGCTNTAASNYDSHYTVTNNGECEIHGCTDNSLPTIVGSSLQADLDNLTIPGFYNYSSTANSQECSGSELIVNANSETPTPYNLVGVLQAAAWIPYGQTGREIRTEGQTIRIIRATGTTAADADQMYSIPLTEQSTIIQSPQLSAIGDNVLQPNSLYTLTFNATQSNGTYGVHYRVHYGTTENTSVPGAPETYTADSTILTTHYGLENIVLDSPKLYGSTIGTNIGSKSAVANTNEQTISITFTTLDNVLGRWVSFRVSNLGAGHDVTLSNFSLKQNFCPENPTDPANSIVCYKYGCGDDGLYGDGHANAGEIWAQNYDNQVTISLNSDQQGPNGELGCRLDGCTNPYADNYNDHATHDDDSCFIHLCTDSNVDISGNNAYNYLTANAGNTGLIANSVTTIATSNITNGIGTVGTVYEGITFTNIPYSEDVTNGCKWYGCTVDGSFNYDPQANIDDIGPNDATSPCIAIVEGCLDTNAINYNDTDFYPSQNSTPNDPPVNVENNSCCANLYYIKGGGGTLNSVGVGSAGQNIAVQTIYEAFQLGSMPSTVLSYTTSEFKLTIPPSGVDATGGKLWLAYTAVSAAAAGSPDGEYSNPRNIFSTNLENNKIYKVSAAIAYVGETDAAFALVKLTDGGVETTLESVAYGVAASGLNVDFEYDNTCSYYLTFTNLSNSATVTITNLLVKPETGVLPLFTSYECSGTNVVNFSWDPLYDVDPLAEFGGETAVTIKMHPPTSPGNGIIDESKTIFQYDNVLWNYLDSANRVELIDSTKVYVADTWTSVADITETVTATSIQFTSGGSLADDTVTSVKLNADAAGSISTANLVVGGGLNNDNSGGPLDNNNGVTTDQSVVYVLEYTQTTDDSNVVLEVWDDANMLGTGGTGTGLERIYFSVPTGKEALIKLQFDSMSVSKYVKLEDVSLKRAFPVGIYDTATPANGVASFAIVEFNYPNSGEAINGTSCAYKFVATVDSACQAQTGCTDNGYEPNAAGVVNDVSGNGLPATDYNPNANFADDSACTAMVLGCMDSTAFNYNAAATDDDGSCYPVVYGCTDNSKFNYNNYWQKDVSGHVTYNKVFHNASGIANGTEYTGNEEFLATIPDTPFAYSEITENGPLDGTDFVYTEANTPTQFGIAYGQSLTGVQGIDVNTTDGVSCVDFNTGCTDSNATNYDAAANTDDGSCCYDTTVLPPLPLVVSEECRLDTPYESHGAHAPGLNILVKVNPDAGDIASELLQADTTFTVKTTNTSGGSTIEQKTGVTWTDLQAGVTLEGYKYGLDGDATEEGTYLNGGAANQAFPPSHDGNDINRALYVHVTVNYESPEQVGTVGTSLDCSFTQEFDLLPKKGTQMMGGHVFHVAGEDVYIVSDIELTESQWSLAGCNVSTSTAIGQGAANTAAIRTACTTPDIAADRAYDSTHDSVAAGVWHLPSKEELEKIYTELVSKDFISMSGEYWSSSQSSTDNAYSVNLGTGTSKSEVKTETNKVRAIRVVKASNSGQDGQCKSIFGCTDPGYLEYYDNTTYDTTPISAGALIDNGDCGTAAVFGCQQAAYLEYYGTPNTTVVSTSNINNPFGYEYSYHDPTGTNAANLNDPSQCNTLLVSGCTDNTKAKFWGIERTGEGADGQNIYGNIITGLPEIEVPSYVNAYGVTIPADTGTVDHFNKVQGGSCGLTSVEIGCLTKNPEVITYTDQTTGTEITIQPAECGYTDSTNVQSNSNTNDTYPACTGLHGCTDSGYWEHGYYDAGCSALSELNDADDYGVLCTNDKVTGCMDPLYLESIGNLSNPYMTHDQSQCVTLKATGCVDSTYAEYWTYFAENGLYPNYPTDSTSSIYCINLMGCMNLDYIEAHSPTSYTTVVGTGAAPAGNGYTLGQTIYTNLDLTSPEFAYNYSLYTATNGVQGDPLSGSIDGSNACSIQLIVGCTDTSAFNYNQYANIPCADCCTANTYGCTDSTASNYNPAATVDDGSCTAHVNGCMDNNAFNFNPLATEGNPEAVSGCIGIIGGCIEAQVSDLDGITQESFPCTTSNVPGCYQPGYVDANSGVSPATPNTNDGSCFPVITGCMDATALNYNNPNTAEQVAIPLDTSDQANFINVNTACTDCCIANTPGCTDANATNYNAAATVDNGSCTYIEGCNDSSAWNYGGPTIMSNDGSCLYCTQYDVAVFAISPTIAVQDLPEGQSSDGSITIEILPYTAVGVTLQWYVNGVLNTDYNNLTTLSNISEGEYMYSIYDNVNTSSAPYHDPAATFCTLPANVTSQTISLTPDDFGCTDSTASNYDSTATTDDGSCLYPGCTDPTADNFDPSATINNGSCVYSLGCTDGVTPACNYDPSAAVDDGSCIYPVGNYNCFGECNNPVDPIAYPQLEGYCEEDVSLDCIDEAAFNFVGRTITQRTAVDPSSPAAIAAVPVTVLDDGTCIYINECTPNDIYKILDALRNTISDHGKTLYTEMRTGMLEFENMEILWKLQLVDYVLNKVGNDTVYNCQDYDHLGKVTYSEGTATSTNYLDRFLTFAFKHGDQHFVQVRNARIAKLETSKFNKNRNKKTIR